MSDAWQKNNGHSIIIEAVSKDRNAMHPVTAYQVDTAHYEANYKTKAVDRSSTSQPADAGNVDISRPATTFGNSVSQDGGAVNPAKSGQEFAAPVKRYLLKMDKTLSMLLCSTIECFWLRT